ncbi:FAD-dependent monooxygenase [Micromonospora wenchangensis]|uniref:FAD-dependent monooxygenase n=1 Tax=Micromonospora wenchangensis TaxID=1185415 RepID=UPI0037F5BA06
MDASVVIVGAGPTGLMLAGELRLSGVNVIVLERLAHPSGESRGIGLTIRTMEVLDQRGLLGRFGGVETTGLGHFGGIPLDLGALGAHHGAARTVPQSQTESVLESWAVELGADMRRGHEVSTVVDRGDHVEIQVRSATSDYLLRSRHLVGCDGGRSTVRRSAGFDFPGVDSTCELFLADLRGVELEPEMIGRQVDGGMVMVARLADGIHRIIVGERGAPPQRRSGPPAFAEVADTWKRLTGIDISHAEPVWVSAFGDAAHLASQYRHGQVLLAGDAAHVHLPAGGQGMNTGIQDAVNLGWKLAAVVRGTAPQRLLDTYHDERHRVGEQLLTNTRAQGLIILGGDEIRPMRDVLSELVGYPEVNRHLASLVSGVGIRYDVGGGRHPLLGMRMPHLPLRVRERDTTSAALLNAGRGVLLDLADNTWLRARAAPWRDRIDVVTAALADPPVAGALADTTAVLIRPDGHVAWAAPGTHDDLPTALDRWFGPAE